MLFTQDELKALAVLLSRAPMSPAESLWAQAILSRLVAFCTPNEPEQPSTPEEEARTETE